MCSVGHRKSYCVTAAGAPRVLWRVEVTVVMTAGKSRGVKRSGGHFIKHPSLATPWRPRPALAMEGTTATSDGGVGPSRLGLLQDFLDSEREYCHTLRTVGDLFDKPLRRLLTVSKEDARLFFGWIGPLCSLSQLLADKVESAIASWDPDATALSHIFSKHLWTKYQEYQTILRTNTLPVLREKQAGDAEFLAFCQQRQTPAKLTFERFLHLPVDRLHQYDNLLGQLAALTPPSHPDLLHLTRTASALNTMVRRGYASESTELDRIQSLFPHDNLGLKDRDPFTPKKGLSRSKSSAKLQRSLPPTPRSKNEGQEVQLTGLRWQACECPADRKYIMESAVRFTMGVQSQERHLFLFNDLLLIAKPRSGSYKLKEKVLVCELWLSSCLEEVCETTLSPEASFVVGWPTTNVVATFSSRALKEVWEAKLQQLIGEAKEREDTKATTALHVLLHNNNVIKLIKVNNKHTAKDCIRTLVEHTENNNGDPSQYQLWVKIGKDESPYPLIGHEYPFCIKMNYIRNLFPHRDLDLPFDDTNVDIKCKFTLRRHYQKVTFVCNVKPSSAKSKKPLRMLWPFRRQKQDSVDSGLGSPPPSPCKLFGQPLPRICPNGSIPEPIMNIFKALLVKAPFTVGIFRKSANARCCRELKVNLERQPNLSLTEVPVLVMASVLKEFLRNLPGCLLQTHMYHDWLKAVDAPTEWDCHQKVLVLLNKLPVENLSLLKHLLCLLWHISRMSDENMMTAANLAVCIGPSMLFSPETTPEEMSLKVPRVVTFLVDHCPSLLGQDCLLLLGPGPDKVNRHHDSGAEESDAGGYRRDDSSIDSLEREEDIDAEPMKCGFKGKMSLSNISRDSGLTLSDTQLYPLDDEVDGESPSGEAHGSRMASLTMTKSAPHLEVVGLDGQRNLSIDGTCPNVVRKRKLDSKKSPPASSSMAGSPCEENSHHFTLNYSLSYSCGVPTRGSPDKVPNCSTPAKQNISFRRLVCHNPVKSTNGLNARPEELSPVLRRSASEESLLMSRFGESGSSHPRKRRAPSPPHGPMPWRSTSQLPTATPDRHAVWFARQNRRASDWKRSQSITKIDESTTASVSTLSLAECSDESTPHVSRSNSRVQEQSFHRICSSASSSSSSTSSEGRKPPPTYQEAINRKTLLHRLHTSPMVTEEMRQHQTLISAKARQLYENSLRQYHEQAETGTHRAVLVSVDSGKPILHRTTSETPRLRHLPPVHISDAQLPTLRNITCKPMPPLRALRDEHAEDWRKEISWSVAQLRTIFTPQEHSSHTSSFKAKVNHHKRSDSVDSQASAEESFV